MRGDGRTGLCGEINRPTQPRAVLDRINAIICERLQPPDEPLLAPTAPLVPQPKLLLEHPSAQRDVRIARDACVIRHKTFYSEPEPAAAAAAWRAARCFATSETVMMRFGGCAVFSCRRGSLPKTCLQL